MTAAFFLLTSLSVPLSTMLMSASAHKRPHDQNLFGIVQGGLDPVLRSVWILASSIFSSNLLRHLCTFECLIFLDLCN